MSEESFDKVIDVNLKGTFLINQLTASAMKEADIKGSIVNISSITGKTGINFMKIYMIFRNSNTSVKISHTLKPRYNEPRYSKYNPAPFLRIY